MPAIPSWLPEPLWDQFAALLPDRPVYDPAHPLGCHRRRIADRIVFEKLLQVLRFGCSYEAIADSQCPATTIRSRPDEWIRAGIFARLKQVALESYDRMVGLVLEEIAVDGCITKTPGGGECAGRSPVDRGNSSEAHVLERCGAGAQPELHLVAGSVAEDRPGRRQQRHRAWLVRVSPAGRRVALPVAERVHGLEVAVPDARFVDTAVRVQLVRLRRPRGRCRTRRER